MKARPHVLIITTDQQRHDALGINGNREIETPNLDALAAGGLNFSRAYSTCPVCSPARRSLLTGLSPDTHGLRKYQDGLEFDPPFTLPGLFRDAGYQTQLVGKMHLHPAGKRYGFDHIILSETPNHRPTSPHQARNDYADFLRAQGIDAHPNLHGIHGNGRLARPHHLEERFHHNTWLAQEAVRFLTEKRDPSCPWFLHLSFTHPHPPLTPPAIYYERYRAKRLSPPTIGSWAPDRLPEPGLAPDAVAGPFFEEEILNAKAGYYGLINHIDDCLAWVFDRWAEYGHPRGKEPVLILFTSDHGEMLGDHHLWRKSLGYEASAHVPFFMAGMNFDLPRGTRDELVCLEDVAPTLLDAAGLDVPVEMDGRSLLRDLPPREVLRGEIAGGGHHANHWIVRGHDKYLYFPRTGEEQLFDLATDPRECTDLSADTARLAPMRAAMAAWAATRDDLKIDPAALKPLVGQPPTAFWP